MCCQALVIGELGCSLTSSIALCRLWRTHPAIAWWAVGTKGLMPLLKTPNKPPTKSLQTTLHKSGSSLQVAVGQPRMPHERRTSGAATRSCHDVGARSGPKHLYDTSPGSVLNGTGLSCDIRHCCTKKPRHNKHKEWWTSCFKPTGHCLTCPVSYIESLHAWPSWTWSGVEITWCWPDKFMVVVFLIILIIHIYILYLPTIICQHAAFNAIKLETAGSTEAWPSVIFSNLRVSCYQSDGSILESLSHKRLWHQIQNKTSSKTLHHSPRHPESL